jgi:hypothetical protein
MKNLRNLIGRQLCVFILYTGRWLTMSISAQRHNYFVRSSVEWYLKFEGMPNISVFFCGRRKNIVYTTYWKFDFTLVCLSHAPTACGSILQTRVKSFIFNSWYTIYYYITCKTDITLKSETLSLSTMIFKLQILNLISTNQYTIQINKEFSLFRLEIVQ